MDQFNIRKKRKDQDLLKKSCLETKEHQIITFQKYKKQLKILLKKNLKIDVTQKINGKS